MKLAEWIMTRLGLIYLTLFLLLWAYQTGWVKN